MVWGCGKGSKFRFHIISMFCQVKDYKVFSLVFFLGGGGDGKGEKV